MTACPGITRGLICAAIRMVSAISACQARDAVALERSPIVADPARTSSFPLARIACTVQSTQRQVDL